jgi:hypothetical protein
MCLGLAAHDRAFGFIYASRTDAILAIHFRTIVALLEAHGGFMDASSTTNSPTPHVGRQIVPVELEYGCRIMETWSRVGERGTGNQTIHVHAGILPRGIGPTTEVNLTSNNQPFLFTQEFYCGA